ncbi:MAG: tetratricopeptide repeat protein [Candidatus Abyssobacteria bacterium SURF_17]|jgi:hypothetical protein|uniref:Tetratricopeptide repeat protein n=1 Tax=Candidatus Abyssobacteria bacterium SURF_17 TaxID=2093361 RepID=A0A419EVQ9_9BACT|nr:MAG: tetratricopeptide repeat protein [Candidatus Abyssubacteria bacterium SURF_17]
MGTQDAVGEKTSAHILALFFLALLPALLYFNSLGNSFHYDDGFYILNNAYAHDLSRVGHFFVSSKLISNITLSGYRPLTMTTFAFNYAVGAGNPFGYHLVNVAIHVLNTLLVYAVSLSLMRVFEVPHVRKAAMATAVLFACHPINTQPVNYTSGRSTLLAAGFSLLSLLLYMRRERAKTGTKRILALAGSLVAYSCALLSKEEAVALPALIMLYELCRIRLRLDTRNIKRVIIPLLSFAVLTLGFMILVVHVLGLISDTPQARGMGENLLTQAKAIFIYGKLMLFPTNLSIDHVIAPSRSLLDPLGAASVIGLTAIVIASTVAIRTFPMLSFGVWWFLLALAPTSTLVALKLVVNEQRMYLPAVGLMLIAGAGFGAALEQAAKTGRSGVRTAVILASTAVALCLSAVTVRRNIDWRTPLNLWTSALHQYPASVRANTQVANLYLQDGRVQQAVAAAEKAVEIAPDFPDARMALASAYSRVGLQEEALKHARAAVDLNPVSSDAHTTLGIVYARLGRYAESEAEWRRALELDPNNREARENLEKLRDHP